MPRPLRAAASPSLQASPERIALPAAGAQLAVRRAGSGPRVVCLHAVGHDSRDFDDLAERLGHAFEFVAVDWPGHGDSPFETAPPGARRYGEILIALLDRLDLRNALLLGNSVGGAAAIVAAAARPERVRGLVLCNPGGLVRHSALVRFVCRRQARLFARGEANDPGFADAFRRYYERKVLTGPRAVRRREEIIASGHRMAPLLRRAWQGFGEPESDLRELAPEVACPVLFAWAKGDRQIRWSFSKAGARRFRDQRVEFFDGSHSAFLESPEAFDAALLRFADSLPSPPAGSHAR